MGFVNVMTSLSFDKFQISTDEGANIFSFVVTVLTATTFHVPKNPTGTLSLAEIPPESVVAPEICPKIKIVNIEKKVKNFFIFI